MDRIAIVCNRTTRHPRKHPRVVCRSLRTRLGHLNSTTFARAFHAAATAAGRPDVTPHTLRHTGTSLASKAGATIADNMRRGGWTSPTMALLYQHSLEGADREVARKLSRIGKKAAK